MLIQCPLSEKKSYYKKLTFPAGEPHIWLNDELLQFGNCRVDIEFNFTGSEDIVELLLLSHTLKLNNISIGNLILPYMPFGQADRVNEPGECFSLRLFCELVNNVIRPEMVTVYDPHSDVTAALLNNCRVVPQWEILEPIIRENVPFPNSCYLICPDAGATKKTIKLAEKIKPYGIVHCYKVRSPINGQIICTDVICDEFDNRVCVICDDQVVGGRTFIEIAKILKKRNAGTVILMTTNGIYSNGLEVFNDIDQIYNRKGLVK